jgi:hypothetical protein
MVDREEKEERREDREIETEIFRDIIFSKSCPPFLHPPWPTSFSQGLPPEVSRASKIVPPVGDQSLNT